MNTGPKVNSHSTEFLFISIKSNFLNFFFHLEFYKGKSGMKLVNFMTKAGADWTMEELEKYRAREETAITGTYGKTTLYTSSAPTSGPQLISLLNILSGFGLSVRDYLTLGYTHDMIETMRVTQNQVSKLGT
jgi:gamma-glutamyltranspeptidase/glutathione hydrolase/leukotriene-C4 hydrolase